MGSLFLSMTHFLVSIKIFGSLSQFLKVFRPDEFEVDGEPKEEEVLLKRFFWFRVPLVFRTFCSGGVLDMMSVTLFPLRAESVT
jgi:hypothetical protein